MFQRFSLPRIVTSALKAFACSQRGNVAITFAIATIPLIAFVGAAIDYSRANSLKVALQGALDATALMVAKGVPTQDTGALDEQARKYLLAILTRPEAKNITVNATYSDADGSQVVVNGSADIDTTLLNVLGKRTITVSGSSTAKWGGARLRVALVLDNTGSMAESGKMAALQSATRDLLAQLKSAANTNDDVLVSIIPFAKDVNVGASGNVGAQWLDWSNFKACKLNVFGICLSWTTGHGQWNGCVADRGGSNGPSAANYDQNVIAPDKKVTESLFPADQDESCPAAMTGLSYDWAGMNSLVDAMSPAGSTNQPIGLVWGWMSLVGGGPFTVPATNSNYTYDQIIILLSDGLNTADRWYGNGSAVSSDVDARMYDASKSGSGTCANIKGANITIYTIQVNTGNDPTSTLLQNCASGTDRFFLATASDQIATAFKKIGTDITKLRIAR
jgi:Flp pilus assembly protein TadG